MDRIQLYVCILHIHMHIHRYCVDGPLPVRVTTRIIATLVWDPKLKLHLPLVLGGGPNPIYIYICTYIYIYVFIYLFLYVYVYIYTFFQRVISQSSQSSLIRITCPYRRHPKERNLPMPPAPMEDHNRLKFESMYTLQV